VALGRAGAFAANPYDGFALQYNPAGFADQTGWRGTLAASWSWQGLTFAPAGGGPSASNSASPFLEPGGAISYGFGPVGPLPGLTVAVGATGPSAIGRLSYPANGPQRYALISTDFFIVYYSAAVAAKILSWLSAGLTLQFVHGTATFSQAVYSGMTMGTDPANDAIAHVDVSNGVTPTFVLGVTVKPLPWLAVGASYRPHFTFSADGTLTTDLPASAAAIGAMQVGNSATFKLALADVFRVGAEARLIPRLAVEADVVVERWNPLESIEILPHGITVTSPNLGTSKPLPDIIFPKNFDTAVSVRLGGDYDLLPGMLTVRGGYLHETSAIPLSSTNVDFGNWDRDMIAVGASYTIPRWSRLPDLTAIFDIAYAHHFLGTRTVTNSTAAQVVTPCLFPGCTDPQPTIIGNGTYSGSLDVLAISLRVTWLTLDVKGLGP
jgi:long-subunit fatty acid transport protein